jgi:class 3 adenylate cyclase
MLTTFDIMNVCREEKNLPMNQLNLKNRITIDTSGNFRNRNFNAFVKPKQSNPAIATTVHLNMNDQNVTSKMRTIARRVENKEEDTDINRINIRKYFDPTIYQMLLNPQEYRLRNEKLVIVFWDIAGFATLCNRLNNHPFIIVDLLINFFGDAERVIRKNDGIVDKFIGDGIMAFFGYHQSNESQMALDGVNTALELRDRFKTIKRSLTQQLVKEGLDDIKFDISLKCGIHIGDTLIGLLETKYRNQITLIGSNVNFANRLEGIAGNEDIIASEEIIKLVKDKFVFESLERDIYSYGKAQVHNILSRRDCN